MKYNGNPTLQYKAKELMASVFDNLVCHVSDSRISVNVKDLCQYLAIYRMYDLAVWLGIQEHLDYRRQPPVQKDRVAKILQKYVFHLEDNQRITDVDAAERLYNSMIVIHLVLDSLPGVVGDVGEFDLQYLSRQLAGRIGPPKVAYMADLAKEKSYRVPVPKSEGEILYLIIEGCTSWSVFYAEPIAAACFSPSGDLTWRYLVDPHNLYEKNRTSIWDFLSGGVTKTEFEADANLLQMLTNGSLPLSKDLAKDVQWIHSPAMEVEAPSTSWELSAVQVKSKTGKKVFGNACSMKDALGIAKSRLSVTPDKTLKLVASLRSDVGSIKTVDLFVTSSTIVPISLAVDLASGDLKEVARLEGAFTSTEDDNE